MGEALITRRGGSGGKSANGLVTPNGYTVNEVVTVSGLGFAPREVFFIFDGGGNTPFFTNVNDPTMHLAIYANADDGVTRSVGTGRTEYIGVNTEAEVSFDSDGFRVTGYFDSYPFFWVARG